MTLTFNLQMLFKEEGMGHTLRSDSLSPESLEASKRELKKSIARMMVYWVVNSRHDLRADLLANNPAGAWAGLDLREAFDNLNEWETFFNQASALFNQPEVRNGTDKISQRVHGEDGGPMDWDPTLDPFCPGNPTLNVMYQAAAAFVDNTTW
jgi:hypothetical protein